MKISVLTPTYNRGELLKKIYNSLLENANYGIQIEWLIMDDGSTDKTQQIVETFKSDDIDIKYFKQENQGKMLAINKLVKKATGDLIVDCDSDDYFTKDAFKIIKEEYEKNEKREDIYALCFLKYDTQNQNMGNLFKKEETTMFDLYFKEGETGEKCLVFYAGIRKKYSHILEKNEKFITEGRMYHQMDLTYKIICINRAIMICEYHKDGYTKNIKKQFLENPYGYYEYFKEILERDMKGTRTKKRIYVIKHYILFSYLTKQYKVKNIRNITNKIIYYLLFIPGIIKSIFYK